VTDTPTTTVETYLRSLVAMCIDPPLVDELTVDDIGTARGTASIARAALCWLREKQDDVLKARLHQELAESDRLVIARLGSAHDDVRGDADWSRIFDVVQARRGAA
jgi:hypothetical protein